MGSIVTMPRIAREMPSLAAAYGDDVMEAPAEVKWRCKNAPNKTRTCDTQDSAGMANAGKPTPESKHNPNYVLYMWGLPCICTTKGQASTRINTRHHNLCRTPASNLPDTFTVRTTCQRTRRSSRVPRRLERQKWPIGCRQCQAK